ncbi:MAG: SagB/ThcOx family dehydrogenase [Candidatus Eremiobacteraeota bacterium]|nr:SagB/ThcOx family dehydrogenase [Candidatus Eremiobacteraeota bacterium]
MDKPGEVYQLSDLREGQALSLPSALKKGKISLEEALWGRKSVRNFSIDKLDPDQIGQILWSAQGINRPGSRFKACPSAGATYPLTAYAVTADGIFEYIPEGHRIRKIADGDHRKSLSQAALGQGWVASAPLSVVITAVYGRTTGRYGDRGVMYVHMEAGHAAQNIHLQAVALGLGSVPVGAFSDDKVAKVMGCDRDEVPLYIIPVGKQL